MELAVYLGVDVGKSAHYALAVDASGKPMYHSGVPNDKAALRKLVDWAREHAARVVVDQPGGTAALLLKLCWQYEVRIGYLHGLAMARAREFYAGESKTDPKDAFVLADVARAHPGRVVWLEPSSDALAHLELLCGYDADLRADANRVVVQGIAYDHAGFRHGHTGVGLCCVRPLRILISVITLCIRSSRPRSRTKSGRHQSGGQ